jgi:hypothetical protein
MLAAVDENFAVFSGTKSQHVPIVGTDQNAGNQEISITD